MTKIVIEPEELHRFAAHLMQFQMRLNELKTETRGKMNHLNETWRDQENAKFVQQFEQDMKPLEKLIHTAEEYSQFLKRKASSTDHYFNTQK